MLLKYVDAEGKQVIIHLKARTSIRIGRGPEAEVCLADTKASRLHCEIRLWDDDYVLKDLKSRNGTYVNETRVAVAVLKVGDMIRVGATLLRVEQELQKGPQTILAEVVQELEEGKKGYGTVLREIVQTTDAKPPRKKPLAG